MKIKDIKITEIEISERKRELRNIDSLAESISQLGLLNPITVSKNNILIAGYHRLEVCKRLGWEIIPANIIDLDNLNEELAEIDENLMRNALTALEQAEHFKKRKEIYEELYPESKPEEQRKKGLNMSAEFVSSLKNSKTFTQDLSEKIGASQRNVRYSLQIANNISDEVKKEIKGTIIEDSKTDLIRLSKIQSPDLQKELVSKVKSGHVKDIKTAIYLQNRQDRCQKINKANISLNDYTQQKYSVIYADPPWSYDFFRYNTACVENHYPTMTFQELSNLPVKEISNNDCVLFMWSTAPKLAEAIELMKVWGFQYKTHCVWDKVRFTLGFWIKAQHELLLIGTKGDIPCPVYEQRIASVYREKRKKHSSKPEYFYELIEQMFPDLPKIELFSRNERENWAVWGNEIKSSKETLSV